MKIGTLTYSHDIHCYLCMSGDLSFWLYCADNIAQKTLYYCMIEKKLHTKGSEPSEDLQALLYRRANTLHVDLLN